MSIALLIVCALAGAAIGDLGRGGKPHPRPEGGHSLVSGRDLGALARSPLQPYLGA